MPVSNVRPINEKKYDISKHRFLELYHFCMQYSEWKDELKYKKDTVRSIEVTDMPTGHGNGDATANLAVRRAELQRKCISIHTPMKGVTAILSNLGLLFFNSFHQFPN